MVSQLTYSKCGSLITLVYAITAIWNALPQVNWNHFKCYGILNYILVPYLNELHELASFPLANLMLNDSGVRLNVLGCDRIDIRSFIWNPLNIISWIPWKSIKITTNPIEYGEYNFAKAEGRGQDQLPRMVATRGLHWIWAATGLVGKVLRAGVEPRRMSKMLLTCYRMPLVKPGWDKRSKSPCVTLRIQWELLWSLNVILMISWHVWPWHKILDLSSLRDHDVASSWHDDFMEVQTHSHFSWDCN